jgi:hypothetical protein
MGIAVGVTSHQLGVLYITVFAFLQQYGGRSLNVSPTRSPLLFIRPLSTRRHNG